MRPCAICVVLATYMNILASFLLFFIWFKHNTHYLKRLVCTCWLACWTVTQPPTVVARRSDALARFCFIIGWMVDPFRCSHLLSLPFYALSPRLHSCVSALCKILITCLLQNPRPPQLIYIYFYFLK